MIVEINSGFTSPDAHHHDASARVYLKVSDLFDTSGHIVYVLDCFLARFSCCVLSLSIQEGVSNLRYRWFLA